MLLHNGEVADMKEGGKVAAGTEVDTEAMEVDMEVDMEAMEATEVTKEDVKEEAGAEDKTWPILNQIYLDAQMTLVKILFSKHVF